MVSPRVADAAVRIALIETAAGIVATDGRAALTLRRLAREVGTSTMAVYTHFGSMEELRRAVREEGFARLRAFLDQVADTSDPVADLIVLGSSYYMSAVGTPNLYRAMFLDGPVDDADQGTGLDTFMYLVKGISRCLDAGRLTGSQGADPAELAVELWAFNHGIVSLQLAGLLPPEQAVARMESAGRSLFLSWGDDPAALRSSRRRAARRLAAAAGSTART